MSATGHTQELNIKGHDSGTSTAEPNITGTYTREKALLHSLVSGGAAEFTKFPRHVRIFYSAKSHAIALLTRVFDQRATLRAGSQRTEIPKADRRKNHPPSLEHTNPSSEQHTGARTDSVTMPSLCGGSKTVQRKLVLLGDGACGKTSLLNVFTRGYFPTVYEPTVFENYVHDIFVDSVHIELSLWDTAGQEEFDRLRSLSYDDTDLIMLCYSVDSKDSLENVESKWVGEIADNCPGVKLVLVALKCDLREQGEEEETEGGGGEPREKRPMINYDQGLEVARRIGALRYLECSAMKNRGVNEAFTEAARVALSVKKDREESKCTVM
ncbi:hypothetical protein ACJZ2D_013524 [Fusarium nematophilum]